MFPILLGLIITSLYLIFENIFNIKLMESLSVNRLYIHMYRIMRNDTEALDTYTKKIFTYSIILNILSIFICIAVYYIFKLHYISLLLIIPILYRIYNRNLYGYLWKNVLTKISLSK